MKKINDDKKQQILLDEIGVRIFEEQQDAARHTFSPEYNQAKQKLLMSMTSHTPKYSFRTLLLAATLVVISISALAVTLLFAPSGERDAQTGVYDYENHIQSYTDIDACKVIPSYIPIRYEQNEDGKYHYTDAKGTEHGISIAVRTMYDDLDVRDVSSVEKLEIAGMRVEIITKAGSKYNRIANCFIEDTGHVVTVFVTEDVTDEELLAIIQGIQLEIDADTVWISAETGVDEMTGDASKTSGRESPSAQNVVIGEVMRSESISYTVDAINLLSVLPNDLQEDKFATRTGYEIYHYLLADNSLKPFERPLTTWDAKQAKSVTSFETVDLQLVEVLLTVENLKNTPVADVEVAPRMSYTTKALLPDSAIQSDEMPFYFDGTDYPQNNHYYFMDMQEHENRQVRLLFAVAKDRLDEAYITFFGSTEQPYALKVK